MLKLLSGNHISVVSKCTKTRQELNSDTMTRSLLLKPASWGAGGGGEGARGVRDEVSFVGLCAIRCGLELAAK